MTEDLGLTVIAGFTGFVGSSLFKFLAERNLKVLGLGSKSLQLANTNHINLHESTHVGEWASLIRQLKPSSVVLCDWQGVLPGFREDDFQFGNIERWTELVKASLDSHVDRIVALGSQAEIGSFQDGINESEVFAPRSAYGRAKQKAFLDIQDLVRDSDCQFLWARLFSIYGPTMSDEWFLKKLVRAIVLGEELETSALTQVWNLLHVTDLSSAILTLLKSQSSGIFNIASEKSFSFLEIVNQISNIAKTESRLKVGSLPFRPDETFVMRPSIEKLRSLGWSETVPLSQGLRDMIAQVQLSN